MKCGYKYCKLGGEVKKEDAIKDGRYYHKECHNKKTIKSECRDILKENYKFMARNINNIIKQLVDDKNIDAEKVRFTIQNIVDNNRELNSPYGISYYLENYEINNEFKKYIKAKKFKEVKDMDVDVPVADEYKFKHKKGGKKSWEIL